MKHDARACAALIAGGIDKYVMDAARDTIALNASMDSECLGWLRVAGPDACDLCVTCASGSTLYHTRTTAGGTPESTYHPGCRCGVVAVFGHGDKAVYVEPETGQRVKLDRADVMKRYEEVVAKGGAARRGKKRVKLLIDDFDDFERRIEGTTSIDELMAIAAEADARIPAKMRKVPAYANLQKTARKKREELRGDGISGGAAKPPGRYGGNGGGEPPRNYKRPNFHEIKEMQEQSDRIFNALSETTKDSFESYTSYGCKSINSILFGHADRVNEVLRNGYSDDIANIRNAMPRYALNIDVISYKGVPASRYANLKEGDTYTFDGFLSTSFSHEVASRYMRDVRLGGSTPMMVEIHVPRDTIAMYLGKNTSAMLGNEFELLLRDKAMVKVISKSDDSMIWEVIGFE